MSRKCPVHRTPLTPVFRDLLRSSTRARPQTIQCAGQGDVPVAAPVWGLMMPRPKASRLEPGCCPRLSTIGSPVDFGPASAPDSPREERMETTPRLTVCGAGAAGMAIAADNALKGLDVKLFELPALAGKLDAARRGGWDRGHGRLRDDGRQDRTRAARRHHLRSRGGGGRRGRRHGHRAGDVPRHVHGRGRTAPHGRPDRPLQHRLLGLVAAGAASGRPPPRRHAGRVQHHAVHLSAARRRHQHRPLQATLPRRRLPR